MSRFFSTSRLRAKALKWKLNGTTENVDWVKTIVEAAVGHLDVSDSIDSAQVNGNPHPTGSDPYHASGHVGKGSMKRKQKASSYHAYPDGTIQFSNPRLPRLQVTSAGVRVIPKDGADASSSGTASKPPSAGQLPQQSTEAASMPPGWTYDRTLKAYQFWDGAKWVSWQYSNPLKSWVRWDGAKWIQHE